MLYFISDLCFFFSGSADLLYVEPKDSDNTIVFYVNLTSHFQELLHVIIIQDNRKAPHISLFECDIDCARSTCFIHSFACVSGIVYNTERGEKMNVRVRRIHWEIRLKDDE